MTDFKTMYYTHQNANPIHLAVIQKRTLNVRMTFEDRELFRDCFIHQFPFQCMPANATESTIYGAYLKRMAEMDLGDEIYDITRRVIRDVIGKPADENDVFNLDLIEMEDLLFVKYFEIYLIEEILKRKEA